LSGADHQDFQRTLKYAACVAGERFRGFQECRGKAEFVGGSLSGARPGVGSATRLRREMLASAQLIGSRIAAPKAWHATRTLPMPCASSVRRKAVFSGSIPARPLRWLRRPIPPHMARRFEMSAITVTDLHYDRELDHAAMASIGGGGGAPWIYGWITPYIESRPGGFGGVVNIIEITNNFTADQMINQFQQVDVHNTGANSNINVSPTAIAGNVKG
jgi:hypothetical protein